MYINIRILVLWVVVTIAGVSISLFQFHKLSAIGREIELAKISVDNCNIERISVREEYARCYIDKERYETKYLSLYSQAIDFQQKTGYKFFFP